MGKPIWGGIGAITAVASVFVAIIALPPVAPARQILYQLFSGEPAQTTTPTPAPTLAPTHAPITITENLQIPCDGVCYFQWGLELQSIEIDRNDNISKFHFKVTNFGASKNTVYFYQLSLQDDNGNTTKAYSVGLTDIDAGNSKIVIGIFPLALQQGVYYTVRVNLNGPDSYKDQSITVSY